MGKKKTVILPSKTFETATEATSFFKNMLGRYEDGEKINPADSRILFELLQRHPDGKIGTGVSYFYKEKSPDYPSSCFHIMRVNGEPTDFSYPRCIKGANPSTEEHFYRACHMSVYGRLMSKKSDLFENGVAVCSQSGAVVTKNNSVYRHTNPTFKEIVQGFIVEEKIELSEELFEEPKDMQYSVKFNNPKLSASFIEYHGKHAVLAIFKK